MCDSSFKLNSNASPNLRQKYFDFCPWYFTEATQEEVKAQVHYQNTLQGDSGVSIGKSCYISPSSAIIATVSGSFELGDDSFVAANAYVTGGVRLGKHCSVNPFATLRENVTAGDHVRIGAYACMIGTNHGFADTSTPVHRQPLSSKGIRLGDDVWVGSHVIIVDGVTVGSHTILAAGAVVTKDVADYAIVAGNPAHVIRWRKKPPARKGSLEWRLVEFGERVNAQLEQVVNRCSEFSNTGDFFLLDQPKQSRRIRPWCDAVEIFAMFDRIPPQQDKDTWIVLLQEFQDPKTGLVPEFMEQDRHLEPPFPRNPDEAPLYNTMIVNYALECLGSNIPLPISNASDITEHRLISRLGELPWADRAIHYGCASSRPPIAAPRRSHGFGRLYLKFLINGKTVRDLHLTSQRTLRAFRAQRCGSASFT